MLFFASNTTLLTNILTNDRYKYDALLSKPKRVNTVEEAQAQDVKIKRKDLPIAIDPHRFIIPATEQATQYFHVYSARLAKMRPWLVEKIDQVDSCAQTNRKN